MPIYYRIVFTVLLSIPMPTITYGQNNYKINVNDGTKKEAISRRMQDIKKKEIELVSPYTTENKSSVNSMPIVSPGYSIHLKYDDNETSRLDALIKAQMEKIALLEEKIKVLEYELVKLKEGKK